MNLDLGSISRTWQHDLRGFLLLDFDVAGLFCSPRAKALARQVRRWAA